MLKHHLCNEADYAQFYPIQNHSEGQLYEIKNDENRGFYCLDWDENEPFEIYGTENDDNYQRLEFLLIPCNSKWTDTGPLDFPSGASNQGQECEERLEEQARYIGSSQILFLVNQAQF